MATIRRNRPLTDEEAGDNQTIRDEFAHKPTREELLGSGDYTEPVPQGAVLALLDLLASMKQARMAAGLTLADVEARTGIDRTALSRLENGRQLNPTIDTLARVGKAVGKRLVLQYADEAASGTS